MGREIEGGQWVGNGSMVPWSMSQCSHSGSRVDCSNLDLTVGSGLRMDPATGFGSGVGSVAGTGYGDGAHGPRM